MRKIAAIDHADASENSVDDVISHGQAYDYDRCDSLKVNTYGLMTEDDYGQVSAFEGKICAIRLGTVVLPTLRKLFF